MAASKAARWPPTSMLMESEEKGGGDKGVEFRRTQLRPYTPPEWARYARHLPAIIGVQSAARWLHLLQSKPFACDVYSPKKECRNCPRILGIGIPGWILMGPDTRRDPLPAFVQGPQDRAKVVC